MGKVRVPALRRSLGEARGAFLVTGVFSLVINLLMLTAPLYMLQIYDRVLASRSQSTLIALTVLAGGMLLIMGLLDLVRSRVLVRVGSRLGMTLNPVIFAATFERTLRGEREGRSQPLRDLDNLRQFITGPGPFALFDAPWVPLYLGLVFLFHPLLGLIALGGAVVLFILAILNELLTRRLLQRANAAVSSAYGFADTTLRNAEALRAMGMLERMYDRWDARHRTGLAFQAQASDRAGTLTAASKAIRMFLQVAILGVGASLAIRQIITPGVMVAASIIMGRALAPVEQAIGQWRQFVSARTSYRRLEELLTDNDGPGARLALPVPKGHVSLENAIVVPPGAERPVLRGISFKLTPGEALGVIGPSASGKTTLARLLVGVWQPYAGSVRLDGADLERWSPQDLGQHIGYLPQGVELFPGTVAENISRFAEEPDPEKIVSAAQNAGVHEMILRLPHGYDTEIGDNNILSGGQYQRIGLARALYGEPALVVLDEPNSNLDAAGDQSLTQAILGLRERKAAVVIMAHRPSAIVAVDKLLMLRDGRIEAFGPKADVLAKVTRTQPAPARGGVRPVSTPAS